MKEGHNKNAGRFPTAIAPFLNGGRCRLRARDGLTGPDGGITAGTRPQSQFPCRAYQGVVGPHLRLRRRSKLPPSCFPLLSPSPPRCFSAWKPNPNRSPLVDDIHSLVPSFDPTLSAPTYHKHVATSFSYPLIHILYLFVIEAQAHLASTARLFSGNSGTQHT